MTRTVHVKLIGLARGGELLAIVTLSTIKPRCLEYWVAKVTVDVDGREISCQVTALTDTSALTSIARWLVDTFGAKVASVSGQGSRRRLEDRCALTELSDVGLASRGGSSVGQGPRRPA